MEAHLRRRLSEPYGAGTVAHQFGGVGQRGEAVGDGGQVVAVGQRHVRSVIHLTNATGDVPPGCVGRPIVSGRGAGGAPLRGEVRLDIVGITRSLC